MPENTTPPRAGLEGYGSSIVDLRPYFADDADLTVPPPDLAPVLPNGECIAQSGALTALIAGTSVGKTNVLITIICEEVKRCIGTGEKIVVVDPEDHYKRMMRRFKMLGMPPEAGDVLIWSHQPNLAEFEQLCLGIQAKIDPIKLMIVDGLQMILGLCGFEENSNDDNKLLLTKYLKPCAKAGPGVLLSDHYGKEEGGIHGRGGSVRAQQIEGMIYEIKLIDGNSYGPMTLANDCSTRPGTAGGVELIPWKDRHGSLGAVMGKPMARLWFTPVSIYRTDWEWTDLRACEGASPKDRLEPLKLKILELVRDEPGQNATQIRDALKGDTDKREKGKSRDRAKGWAGIDVTNATKALRAGTDPLIKNTTGKDTVHAYSITQKGRDTLAAKGLGTEATFDPAEYRKPEESPATAQLATA